MSYSRFAALGVWAQVLGAGGIIIVSVKRELEGEKTHFLKLFHANKTLWIALAPKTYRKNLFFFEEFSITNSFDRPFFPSSTIQAFSLVSASSVSPVVIQISYSFREKTWTVKVNCFSCPQTDMSCTASLPHKICSTHMDVIAQKYIGWLKVRRTFMIYGQHLSAITIYIHYLSLSVVVFSVSSPFLRWKWCST